MELLWPAQGENAYEGRCPVSPCRAAKNGILPMGAAQMNAASFGRFLSENSFTFAAVEPRKNLKKSEVFMKSGISKKQKRQAYFLMSQAPSLRSAHTTPICEYSRNSSENPQGITSQRAYPRLLWTCLAAADAARFFHARVLFEYGNWSGHRLSGIQWCCFGHHQ